MGKKEYWYGKKFCTEKMCEEGERDSDGILKDMKDIWIGPLTEEEFEYLKGQDLNICDFRHQRKEE